MKFKKADNVGWNIQGVDDFAFFDQRGWMIGIGNKIIFPGLGILGIASKEH